MKTVNFDADENGMRLMAAFVAQLVKEGVTFEVRGFGVTVTGGF